MTRTEELLAKRVQRRTPESARELLRSNFAGESDPWEKIESLREIGKEKAKWEGVSFQLEHERKIMLATIANEIATAHAKEPLSEAKLDRMARADARYGNHIKGLSEAIRKREYCKSEYWAVKSDLEWDRAAIAHLNALSKLEEPV